MRRWLISCLILWLIAGTVRAEDALSPLRARLKALAEHRSPSLKPGVVTSIAHVLDVAEKIQKGFPTQAIEWRERAARYLSLAEQGRDPYIEERGRIVSRGYSSPISQRVQGYTVYIPPDYTPDKSYPLMIVLHGGSSNGNLFLGVVLGNNMNWKEYDFHLWDRYEPRWSPDWIVAAADGYGQVLWRWMGEQDVLDVIDDIQQSYNVDTSRVVLSGLSNGGMGAYAIGSRHAWRFSVVQAMAGSPSWIMYAGEAAVPELERKIMQAYSAYDLAENWFGTDFRYYHGTVDPGPMRPAFVHALDQHVDAQKIPHRAKWFEAGHDLLYLVHRHGSAYKDFENIHQQKRPSEVHVVTGDYRAARQHWLTVTRFMRYPELAHLRAKVSGARVEITSENVAAFTVLLRDVPSAGAEVELVIDGVSVLRAPRATLGERVSFVKGEKWARGEPSEAGLQKKPGLSGPLTDAYYGRMVHVYGTQRPERVAELKKLAEKGAHGWPLWLWTVDQEVIKDSEVTPELAKSAHLVLYGTPGDNAVLDRLRDKLPIRVEADAVVVGDKRYTSKGVGTRFIYPNPEAPNKYLIVMAAPTIDGLRRGHNLPDFLPDYVVYDANSAAMRARLAPAKPPPARGFFGATWRLEP
jgi:hypothetical protein